MKQNLSFIKMFKNVIKAHMRIHNNNSHMQQLQKVYSHSADAELLS